VPESFSSVEAPKRQSKDRRVYVAADTVCTGAGAPTHHSGGLRNATHHDIPPASSASAAS